MVQVRLQTCSSCPVELDAGHSAPEGVVENDGAPLWAIPDRTAHRIHDALDSPVASAP